MTWCLTAVRHEVNNLESSVVVQELEFAINRALYGLLWSLGNQYIVCRINKFGIFTISWIRNVCMNVKIRNKFIEIKYSVSNGLVIFITNYRWLRILEISSYRRSNVSVLKDNRYVNKFNSFIFERNFYEMPFVICFRIDKWTESMLSITSSQECSIVQLVISIVEFISLSI